MIADRGRPHQARVSASPTPTCAGSEGRSTTSSTSRRSTTCPPARRRSRSPTSTARATRFASPKPLQRRLLPPRQLDRGGGPLRRRVPRGHVREAEKLDHPYFRTKHESETIVRERVQACRGASTGRASSSATRRTGEIDKIDGPYYFFKLIQKLRRVLPPWLPTVGVEGGRINIVPVDYVADAIDHIAHKNGLDGRRFHLTDPEPDRIGEVLNIFAKAGHAPLMTMRVNARMFGFIPAPIVYGLAGLAPVKRAMKVVLTDLGIPATCSSSSTGRRATTIARRRRR